MKSILLSLLVAPLLLGCSHLTSRAPDISLTKTAQGQNEFRVFHNAREEYHRSLTEAQLSYSLSVYVTQPGQMIPKDQPAILGKHLITKDHLVFQPQFPLEPGLTYRAVYFPAWLTHIPEKVPLETEFTIPAPPRKRSTIVTEVYPTASTLPENQLKFYIHFSSPMKRGQVHQHVRLLHASGGEVELPFLILDQELWNHDGDRLTLLFDPGRVKRELLPREQSGPALEEGHRYILVIDSHWKDSKGNRLKKTFRKKFKAGAPDYESPSTETWKVKTPAPLSSDPLILDFPEPLDHALLNRLVWVAAPSGKQPPGTVQISNNETRWSFIPDSPWPTTPLNLVVRNTLEDLAGNSIGQPFEVTIDPSNPTGKPDLTFLPIFK